ncbi:hypothetical protein ACNKHW_18145 [Shigella flexneri]
MKSGRSLACAAGCGCKPCGLGARTRYVLKQA